MNSLLRKSINKLANSTKSRLFVNFDYNQKNKFLFDHLDKIYAQFEKLGFTKIVDNTPSEGAKFRSIISDKLFRIHKSNVKKDYKNKIAKVIAHDREKEIELIASEIKKTIVEQKVEPHKICVAFNFISNYSTLIRDIFSKNGLPFNLSDRISLDNSKPVTAVINFLEIAENDFYYNNIFRALSSGFIELEGIDYSNLYSVSAELKIVSGKNNWINSLEDELGNVKYKSDEDDNELSRLKESYAKALEDIKSIAAKLSPFDGKLTIAEFKNRLFDFINEIKLPFKLLHIGDGDKSDISEENVRGFTNFIDTITEIFQLLEEEKGSDIKFGLRFFMDQMRTACGWARFNVKEKSDYGVQVTTLEEIRGLQFDYLFIGGMCDGDLPTRYSPEIFYSGNFKKQAFTHQTEERNLFYQALCCWKEKLYLSYPQTESGRETVASTFLNDFEELFEISTIDESVYTNTIFSKEELQIISGKNGFENLPENILSKIDAASIQKSIDINRIREEESFTDSPFTGYLNSGGDDVLQKLNSYSQKQYSISQLETYAKCPFKFFVERVLNIEKIEEPTEDIEAIEMGRLLHEILFEFYTKIRDAGLEISGSDEKTFSEIKNILWEIADEQIQSTAFKSPLTFYEKERMNRY